ncbi:hypothetical protein ACEWAO_23665, partial [Vibrio parahaemolyticus]
AAAQDSAEGADAEVPDDTISAAFARPVVRSWTSADLPGQNVQSGQRVSRLPASLADRLSSVGSGAYGRGDYLAMIALEAASAGVPRELVQA